MGWTTHWPLVLAVGLAASCALDGFVRSPPPVGAGSGGAGGMGGAGGGGEMACDGVAFPGPPAISAAGGEVDFVVALRTISFQESGDLIGIDLDKTCTCHQEAPPTCKPPEDAEPDSWCDGDGGVDNAAADLFLLIGAAFGATSPSQAFSNAADQGKWTLLTRISEYNGEADDDQVLVEFFASSGFGEPPPAWQGEDAWPLNPNGLDVDEAGMPDPNRSLYRDENAYVVDSQLVATVPGALLTLSAGESKLDLTFAQAAVAGRLVLGEHGWGIEGGVFAGRLPMVEAFAGMASYRNHLGEGICTDEPIYTPAKEVICQSRDIHAGLAGPTVPCDAISVGLGVEAEPAVLGPVVVLPPPMSDFMCPPETDPALDDCDAAGGGGAGGMGGGGT